jgi:hypothetical protein
MADHLSKKNKAFLEIDTTELRPHHVRQMKNLMKLMEHILSTDSEVDYFDGSAEAIRMCAALIKQARFIEGMKEANIPYADQVLEFSVDVLQEHISTAKVVTYDN